MEIILLQNISNLGKIGDKVVVANGYGRNFLLKKGKALRFSKENQDLVNKKKDQLNSDIPVELILPYSREVRILGSRVSLLFAKKGINVFFYTALLNKKISNLDSYNLSLINKLSKFDNVKLIRL